MAEDTTIAADMEEAVAEDTIAIRDGVKDSIVSS